MSGLPDLRIKSRLGSSGSAEVFSAYDSRYSRQVAIKQIRAGAKAGSAREECRRLGALAQVRHPAFVQIFDVLNRRDDSSIIMVMEYVAGRTLSSVIAEGPLDIGLALTVGRKVAQGLMAIHSNGLVHGDIRSENILLTREGEVKVLLGGSSLEETAGSRTALGSPEQVQGLAVDHRSDLFALGVVLYEMVTGLSPFEDLSLEAALSNLVSKRQIPAAELDARVPSELSYLIDALLEKDPDDRIQGAEVDRALEEITGRGLQLVQEVMESSPGELPFEVFFSMSRQSGAAARPQQQFNSQYRFDTFVVGKSNEFAHAASEAVARNPSKSYNPLFLYGGVGLGKTHLLHAIGSHIEAHQPDLRVLYRTAEQFVNELIAAIRFDRMAAFRENYRTIDVLLIDDVQFLANKERTQEEFFHTFKSLYESEKQIVLSSDSSPRDIPTLEERLRSRFEWGLIADIQPPELEAKVVMLQRKADREGVAVPDEVCLFIARQVRSNIRELEGLLNRVIAYSSLTGQPISLDLAEQTLKDILPPKKGSRRRGPVELQDPIGDLYQELRRLMAQDRESPEIAEAINDRLEKLRALQQEEAEALRRQLETTLHLEPGSGIAALEEAKRLLARNANPPAANPSSR